MQIRKTRKEDLPAVMEIYRAAQQFMIETGNPTQWGTFYPDEEMIIADIEGEFSHVCIKDGEVVAVFYFDGNADEADYKRIDGAWLNDNPYGVVHRIAAKAGSHAGGFCLDWCVNQCGNVRIDTHDDNIPMQRLLKKQGFTYCGRIELEKYGARIAFHKKIMTIG